MTEHGSDRPLPREDADEVLALVAHEIRAPLTVIAGYLEILGRPLDAGSRTRALAEATRAVKRAESLLDDLERAEGAERCFAPSEIAPVSISELADEVATSFGYLQTHRIRVTAEGPGVVAGDAARLRQVLTNLVVNAISYSPAGTSVIIAVDSGENAVTASVEDEGPGIPESDRERVFGRSVRLYADEERPGAGVGLYIVRTIVEAHGGTVHAEPGTAGRGTRIVVELPVSAC